MVVEIVFQLLHIATITSLKESKQDLDQGE